MRKRPLELPPPTMFERADAAKAARALRAAIADPSTIGAKNVAHIDFSRPRRGVWIYTWTNLPGFSLCDGFYHHTSLPGWQYARDEIKAELIPDLEALAERGVRPTEETTNRGACVG